jgi:hypothetical protein
MMRKFVLLILAGLFTLLAGSAHAQHNPNATWNVTFSLQANSPTFDVFHNDNNASTADNQRWYAGVFNARSNSGKPSPWLPDRFESYCVDLSRRNANPDTYDVEAKAAPPTNFISAEKWGRISYIYENWGTGSVSTNTGAAVQLAIWYVLEGNSNLQNATMTTTGGTFYLRNTAYNQDASRASVIGLANAFLSQSYDRSSNRALYLNAEHLPNSTDNQSMIGPAVPEGDAIPLLTAGLPPVLLMLRRRMSLLKQRSV